MGAMPSTVGGRPVWKDHQMSRDVTFFLLKKNFLNWKSQLEFKSQCNRVELLSFRSVVQTGNAPGSDFVWILRKYRDTVRFTFWWQHGAVGSCVNLMNFVAQLILRVHKLRSCCECGFSSFTTRHPFKTENVKRSKRTTRRFPTHEICTTLHQLVCELWGLMTGCWYLKTLKNCSVTGLVMVKVRSLALILWNLPFPGGHISKVLLLTVWFGVVCNLVL